MFTRLARLTYAHPKWVLTGIVAFVAVAIVAGGGVADRLKPAGFTDPASESALAVDQAAQMLGHDPSPGVVVVARAPAGDASTPAARAEIQPPRADRWRPIPRWPRSGRRSSRAGRRRARLAGRQRRR